MNRSAPIRLSLFVALLLVLLALSACQTANSPFEPVIPIREDIVGDLSVFTLPNGLRAVHRRTYYNEIVGISIAVPAGSALDPPEKAGLAALLANLLTKGAGGQSSEEIAEELGQRGIALNVSASQDLTTITAKCAREDLSETLDLLADIVFRPELPQDHMELERERLMAGIRRMEDTPSGAAARRFKTELFGAHAYARPVSGDLETLPRVTRADLLNRHDFFFIPARTVIGIVGDISEEQVEGLLSRHMTTEGVEPERFLDPDSLIYPDGSRHIISKPAEQGFLITGVRTCPVDHRDRAPLAVAAAVLGGGMSSRFFQELRDRQGLAYAVSAQASFLKKKGWLHATIGTEKSNLETAEEQIWRMITQLREEPIPEEELERAKNYLAGEHLRAHETNLQKAASLACHLAMGMPLDSDERYRRQIESVTARDVMYVANKYFVDPTTVVVYPMDGGK